MEDQLAEYIEGEVGDCLLNSYFEQGFSISLGAPSVEVEIGMKRLK